MDTKLTTQLHISWIITLHILVEIRKNTKQFCKYRTVEGYAATASAWSTHLTDADVKTVTHSGLNHFHPSSI